nr:MAG TPA: hypothetical protein [Caudoviricetes sp.]
MLAAFACDCPISTAALNAATRAACSETEPAHSRMLPSLREQAPQRMSWGSILQVS